MAVQRRRELTESSQLAVHEEQWFLLDCLLAVVGFAGWVAVTGAFTALGAREVGVSLAIEGTSTQTLGIVAAATVAWLVLPGLAAAYRVRSRVTNVSGNVETRYRFESPGTLLWPPAAILAVAAVAIAVSPVQWPAYGVAFVAGAHLLVRTTAFSYRVFSFSYPALVHAASFVTFTLYAAVGVVQLGSVAGASEMVRDAAVVLDLPIDVYGSVGVGPFAFPTLMTVAAATPVVLVGGYLVVQSLAAFYVRQTEPTIDRKSLRAGQRNPFQPTIANGAGGVQPSSKPAPSTPSEDQGTNVPVHIQTTRVYDPDGEVADAAGIETGPAGSGDPQCRTCGAGFSRGTEIRFCPNCGQRLDDG